jgi:hypothetical protein
MVGIIFAAARAAVTAFVTAFVYELGTATGSASSLGDVNAWVTALGRVANDVINLVGLAQRAF